MCKNWLSPSLQRVKIADPIMQRPLITRTHWHDVGLRELNKSDVEARLERRSMRRVEQRTPRRNAGGILQKSNDIEAHLEHNVATKR